MTARKPQTTHPSRRVRAQTMPCSAATANRMKSRIVSEGLLGIGTNIYSTIRSGKHEAAVLARATKPSGFKGRPVIWRSRPIEAGFGLEKRRIGQRLGNDRSKRKPGN